MKNLLVAASLALVATAFSVGGAAVAQEEGWTLHHFGRDAKHTNISFVSETPVETINGSTNSLAGTFYVNWDKGTAKCNLRVPVKSLQTGIEKRDGHLQNDVWLDAATYPIIQLRSSDIKLTAVRGRTDVFDAKVKGKLTVHGVEVERTIDAKVYRLPATIGSRLGKGDWVKVDAKFDVNIKTHGVTGHTPEIIGTKVAEVWKASFSCSATTAPPPKAR